MHPALSSPSATPLRSGGYADKVKRADDESSSAEATKQSRTLEGKPAQASNRWMRSLLEYAVMHDDEAEAARLRAELPPSL